MIGFIGAGNMGFAIIKGLLSKSISHKDICVYERSAEKVDILKKIDVNVCESAKEVAKKADYLFIAVKPNVYDNVLNEIKDDLKEGAVIITIAAGYEVSRVESIIGNKKIVRTMPNTPALCSEGFTAIYFNNNVAEEDKHTVVDLISSFGECSIVEKESMINAYSAVSGSGPAYVAIMIEAMADAAVLLGVPRKDAYKLCEQTVLGTAKLNMETSMLPAAIKDMVCSPGGTTIEGVRTLEEKGFRSSIIECIINTYKKNLDMENIR